MRRTVLMLSVVRHKSFIYHTDVMKILSFWTYVLAFKYVEMTATNPCENLIRGDENTNFEERLKD